MIKKLEDFNKYIAMAGFRNVKIEDVNQFLNFVRKETKESNIQFFDAKLVATEKHIYFAALNALNAFANKMNISNSVDIETLLYASAQRQIKKAVELLGIKNDSSQLAVLIIAETEQKAALTLDIVSRLVLGERDDGVLELTDEKIAGVKSLFNISSLEIEAKLKEKGFEKEALVDLVVEHVALLATQR